MDNSRGISLKEAIIQSPTLVKDCFLNNVIKVFKTLPPTVVQLNVTSKCNSRCIMCNIWKTKRNYELSAKEWKAVFSDKLFNNIEYLLLSGGEPTILNNLFEIIKYILPQMPRLKKLLISTNGLSQHMAAHSLPQIIDYCNKNNVQVTITVSLDGVEEIHDKIRNIPNAFRMTVETINYLKKLQDEKNFRLNVGTTIIDANIDDLDNITDFCQKNDLPVVFYTGWVSETYYNNVDRETEIEIHNDKKECLINFLSERIAESSLLNGDAYYYSEVIRMLRGNKRRMPCPFIDQGLVLDSTGDIYYCNNSRKIGNALEESTEQVYINGDNLPYRKYLAKNICPSCQSSCLIGISLSKQIFPYLRFLLSERFR